MISEPHRYLLSFLLLVTSVSGHTTVAVIDFKSNPDARDHGFENLDCKDGFQLVPGDILGWGQIGSTGNVKDTDGCGDLCRNTTGCKSYEYSTTEKICNLNTDSEPTAEVYRNYAFCVAGRNPCSLNFVSISDRNMNFNTKNIPKCHFTISLQEWFSACSWTHPMGTY